MLYPLDPRGTVTAAMNEMVELGLLCREWDPDRGWVCRANRSEAIDAFWRAWEEER